MSVFRNKLNSDGIVSITVTMVIMILITLVVTSFSLIVRREQRLSLDRQLSTQAFYAAEVGVQHAQHALRQYPDIEAEQCNSFDAAIKLKNGGNNPYSPSVQAGIGYSCLLIDNKPGRLKYDGVSPDNGSIIVPINPVGAHQNILVSWETKDSNTFVQRGTNDPPYLFPQSESLKTGVLRVTLMKADSLSRGELVGSSQTMYLYPNSDGNPYGTINYKPSDSQTRPQQGQIVPGNCGETKEPKSCNVLINLEEPGSKYFMHIKPLYQPTDVEIQAHNAPVPSASSQVSLENAQATVDVTGKAQDVLRRIQVRVPIDGGNATQSFGLVADAALETTDSICKLLRIYAVDNVTDDCIDENNAPPLEPPGGVPGSEPSDPSGDGNAAIRGLGDENNNNGNGSGNGNSNPDPYRWRFTFENNSNNPPNLVSGCRWDWGDGTYTNNQKCLDGQRMTHQFPNLEPVDVPDDCKKYTVKLTVYFVDGYPIRQKESNPWQVNVPQGPVGKEECGGQYR